MADGRKHPNAVELVAFARKCITSQYIKLLADWVKDEYPGSAQEVLPQLRQIYAQKKQDEKKLPKV